MTRRQAEIRASLKRIGDAIHNPNKRNGRREAESAGRSICWEKRISHAEG